MGNFLKKENSKNTVSNEAKNKPEPEPLKYETKNEPWMDDFFNKKWKIGKYEVNELCFQSYPCRHYIMDTETGIENCFTGTEIYILLKKENLTHPHFDEYKKFAKFAKK